MRLITGDTPDEMLIQGLDMLQTEGTVEHSRNGSVLVYNEPVCSMFTSPMQRVSFNPLRNANPFFHLIESLWMLAGRNDVAFVANFVKRMQGFSDDGTTLRGAYGHRWRCHFGYDQLMSIVTILRRDPTTRRAVLTMWDPKADMDGASLDIPCNTHVYFRVLDGALDITVCNRSNDIVWGLYGANCVHFSVMQEFVATACELSVGAYYHMSNNYHYYPGNVKYSAKDLRAEKKQFYPKHLPLYYRGSGAQEFLADVQKFLETPWEETRYPFLDCVAAPMYQAWEIRKDKEKALGVCERILAADWRLACTNWIERNIDFEVET